VAEAPSICAAALHDAATVAGAQSLCVAVLPIQPYKWTMNGIVEPSG
jgi:hypothetical protein